MFPVLHADVNWLIWQCFDIWQAAFACNRPVSRTANSPSFLSGSFFYSMVWIHETYISHIICLATIVIFCSTTIDENGLCGAAHTRRRWNLASKPTSTQQGYRPTYCPLVNLSALYLPDAQLRKHQQILTKSKLGGVAADHHGNLKQERMQTANEHKKSHIKSPKYTHPVPTVNECFHVAKRHCFEWHAVKR